MLSRVSWVLMYAIVLAVTTVNAQSPRGLIINRQPKAVLIDALGKANGEDRRARIDSFFIQIYNNPGSMGYIFVFCGRVCRYGEVESHFRGIELKTAFNKYPRDRMVLTHGGYRDSQEVEMWLVPKGASVPVPTSTVKIMDVIFTKATKPFIEWYDCCGLEEPIPKALPARKRNGQKGSNH